MSGPPRAIFLARRVYRQRRLMDLGRLLPAFGLFLFALPVVWAPPEDPARDLALTGLYVFGVWALLILVAAVLARAVGLGEDREAERSDG